MKYGTAGRRNEGMKTTIDTMVMIGAATLGTSAVAAQLAELPLVFGAPIAAGCAALVLAAANVAGWVAGGARDPLSLASRGTVIDAAPVSRGVRVPA